MEFKRAYARAASTAGLTKEQIVRIYGFEATGNGTYDVQSGLEYNKPGQRAVSTALGYNQLLATNSVELLAENGDQIVSALKEVMKRRSNREGQAIQRKIAVVEKMIELARTVPDDWVHHQLLGNTAQGLAIHAVNFDRDIGPLMQVQNLVNSVVFARGQGHTATLTATELEMMNFTGDGNGFDMIAMPVSWRKEVPTANFLSRGGYERNPIAQKNNVVASLMAATAAAMDEEVKKKGARDLASAFSR